MADTRIWSDAGQDLTICLSHGASPEVISLLERTTWGSRNLRYRIRGVAAKLARLNDPYVFRMEKRGQLAAVCILNRRTVQLLGVPYDSMHFVMIATDPALEGQGLAGLLSVHIRRYLERHLDAPAVAYAYIEATTDYSLRISNRVGHSLEAVMPLTVFSRLWPKDDETVRPISDGEVEEIAARLYRLYEGHGFADFDDSLKRDEYFVLRHQGRIVAGAQAEALHWSVVEMPGWRGAFLVKVLPWIPLLGRMLPLQDFRFLRFGNLLVEPGHEAHLVRLLETLLARHNTRVGLIMMDRRSPVLGRIRAFGRLGPLQRALEGATKAVADFKGVSEDDIARIAARPMLLSPRDVF